MKLGEVCFFESDQATGHDLKPKFHVYLGSTDFFRAPDEHVFLFISSGDYGNCFPLARREHAFLQRDSYISCGKLVYYATAYLSNTNVRIVGKVDNTVLSALHGHLAGHEVMVAWEIEIACRFLAAAL